MKIITHNSNRMKYSLLIIIVLVFGCSPKFTEYNDSGFGGGMHKLNTHSDIAKNEVIKTTIENEQRISNIEETQLEISNKTTKTYFKINDKKSKGIPAITSIPQLKNNIQIQNIVSKTNSIFPPKNASKFRIYFFAWALAAFLVSLYLIIDLTGPGAGTFGGVLAVLTGITGILFASVFLHISKNIDGFVKDRCLLTKIAITLWFLMPLSIALFLIGIIYDSIKKHYS